MSRRSFLHRHDIRSVIVFRALQLGDMLCSVPALRALRSALPDAGVVLTGLPWAAQFARRFDAYIDEFIPFPGHPLLPEQAVRQDELTAYYASMCDRGFDLALQLHGSGDVTNHIVAGFGARAMAGFTRGEAGQTGATLLLPRWGLSGLVPDPAARWLGPAGAQLRLSHRVDTVGADGAGWRVDDDPFDAVVLACSATEAARLAEPHAPEWAAQARGLQYEPIVTVYAHSPDTRLPQPMLALRSTDREPAQFVFDLGLLSGMEGVLAFVISGAAPWVARGVDATMAATLRQGQQALAASLRSPLTGLRALTEKRATFLCTPGLVRPPARVRPGLTAAGDYVDGPYPATLEGAVRAGVDAARALG